jgi:hypothetical protein
MGAYPTDREWSDKMLPQIRRWVGPYLLEPAPLEFDCKEATDLMVLRARDMRIAARVRRSGYAEKYEFQFTLRWRRDSGAETELSKIVNGWGDWMFYGHADKDDMINLWWLIDLSSFRAALIRDRISPLKYGTQANHDGTYFKWFDLRSFPSQPPILIGSSRPLSTLTHDLFIS